ncbi:MAG: membrane protein insertase YidC [Vicinamibacterales bacterium]
MERRVLLAISLSFLVLFLYQSFLLPPPPGDVPAPNAVPQVETPGASPGATTAAADGSAPLPPPAPVDVVVGEQEERNITVDSGLVRAVFTNRGGRLVSWVLKEYRTSAGEPLDLVPAGAPVLPFSLGARDEATTTQLNSALYRVSGAADSTLVVGSSPADLTFEVELSGGLRARKRFTFEPSSYLLRVSASVDQGEKALNPALVWGPGLGDEIARMAPGNFFSPNYLYHAQAIFEREGSVERIAATSMTPQTVYDGQFTFAGIDDHYFVAATVTPGPMRLEYSPASLPPATAADPGRYVTWSVTFPSAPDGVRFFIGPKQFDVLRAVTPEFTRVIYFGMFAWLAAPLLGALQWVNGFVGNYGWSIVILTILINLAMWPLRHKSVVSMRKMQDLQPQMKTIQERYAQYKITDPERQKMNQEVMELYRSKGVNPASGCVPMLLTMPFLFAFYAMLSQAIEIRGADFLGWIDDLSAPDPLFITPVLMGATMFWQQRMTPSTADPTQQKVMMVMPFMFTFMSFNFPSGLVIYWMVSNLWGIGQQYFTNYLIGPPKVHNVRPPAERAAPRSGRAENAQRQVKG